MLADCQSRLGEMPPNNRMQLTRSAPLQGRLAPPSQLIRVLCGHGEAEK